MPLLKVIKLAWLKLFLLLKMSSLFLKKMAELQIQYPNDYLAIYDLPLDRDLPKMGHYPSVAIGKEEFE